MSEHFLNLLQHWLAQLQQAEDSTDWLERWRSTLDVLPQPPSPQISDLVFQLTRQNHRFEQLATALLAQDEAETLDRDGLLDTYRQHLDRLCNDWIHSSCFLPDQLALLTPFFTVQPQQETDLQSISQQLERFQHLSSLPRTLLHHLQRLTGRLHDFQQAQQQHSQQLSTLNRRALSRLADHLESSGINSVDELHTRWVAIYEADYSEALLQDDFITGFNTLLESGCHVRLEWQTLINHLCSRFGLVSLADFDELSARHQNLQDRVWALEEQVRKLSQPGNNHDQD